MVTFDKKFDSFEAFLKDLADKEYSDSMFPTYMLGDDNASYDSFCKTIIQYISNDLPSVNNINYPTCASFAINSNSMRYMKNNLGMAIISKVNKKSGTPSFHVFISFNRPSSTLGNNPLFNKFMNDSTWTYNAEDERGKTNKPNKPKYAPPKVTIKASNSVSPAKHK